jgi:sodium-dependent dicarboxylate transporter 2/3/5
VVFGLILTFLLCGFLRVFDPWGMPGPSQVALVIMLIAATLWVTEIVPLYVTSFVILALSVTWLRGAMATDDIEIATSTFMAAFSSDIIFLFLGGFVLSSALHKYRLDEQLARWVIAKTGNSVPRLVLGVMAITAFLSMWLSNTATAAMMMAVCLPIARSLPATDRARKAILLSVPFAANVGGMGTPIGSPPNAIAIEYLRGLGAAPGFLTWVLIGVPLVVLMILVIWLVLMALYRDETRQITFETEALAQGLSLKGRVVLGVALLTVLGWLTGAVHHLSSGTVALLPLLVLFGTRILDVKDLRSLSWDVLLLMGGGLCLGEGMTASGLAEWLVERLPTEGMSIWVLVIVFGLTGCLMSTLMSNTASANLLMPIVVGLSVTPMPPILICLAFSCSLAMTLPISTPPNAIAFSSGEIGVKDIVKPGLVLTLIGVGLVYTLGYWWIDILGVF